MGLFKKLKDLGDARNDLAAAAQAAQASGEKKVEELQAGLTPGSFDPADPAFAPIEGVSLEQYAQLCAAIVKQHFADEAAMNAYLAAHGVPEGRWAAIAEAWNKRMSTNRTVTNRYAVLFAEEAT